MYSIFYILFKWDYFKANNINNSRDSPLSRDKFTKWPWGPLEDKAPSLFNNAGVTLGQFI